MGRRVIKYSAFIFSLVKITMNRYIPAGPYASVKQITAQTAWDPRGSPRIGRCSET